MNVPSPPSRKGRPLKRARSHAELAALAARFAADWHEGDNVMTWIRRHEGSAHALSRLVRDGWSWRDLGRALALAGIRYGTAPAISGEVLCRKAWVARSDEHRRQTRKPGGKDVERRGKPAGPIAAVGPADALDALPSPERAFPLVAFKDASPPAPQPGSPALPPASSPLHPTSAREMDADILRRVFGHSKT